MARTTATNKTRKKPRSTRTVPVLRRLEDQVALITGGSGGIGSAIAEALAREGASVVISGRDDEKLHAVASRIARSGGAVTAHVCDVRDEESVDNLLAAIRKHFGQLDILINNAGIAHANHHIDRLSIEDWRLVLETNLTGAFLVTQSALPLMRSGSTVVNNISVSATHPFPGMAAYNASKAGLLAFTNTLREELRTRGIRVMALVPGATDTGIWDQFWKSAPRQRMISPSAVADALVTALCLPENATVQDLVIAPTGGAL